MKTVLVTGSSKGLGKELIKEYAKLGYNVVINYNSSEKEAFNLKEEIEKIYNSKVLCIKCDISNEEEVIKMKDEIISNFNTIDILVNNAALEITSELNNKNYTSFKKVFDVNVIGTFLVTKYIGMEMLKNKSGKIVNISSNNSFDKYDPSTMEYDASKSAINSLTKNFAKEFAPFINVNAVAPGWIKTDTVLKLDNYLDGNLIKEESKKIYVERFADVKEICNLVLFLTSDDASYINGEIIRIDGGC